MATVPQAAWTAPGISFPAYINARVEMYGPEPAVIVSVRSEGAQGPADIRMSPDVFSQWLAEAQRVAQEAMR